MATRPHDQMTTPKSVGRRSQKKAVPLAAAAQVPKQRAKATLEAADRRRRLLS